MFTYLRMKLTITGKRADQAAGQADERNEGVIFKNCVH